jgi:hypothetical protein
VTQRICRKLLIISPEQGQPRDAKSQSQSLNPKAVAAEMLLEMLLG